MLELPRCPHSPIPVPLPSLVIVVLAQMLPAVLFPPCTMFTLMVESMPTTSPARPASEAQSDVVARVKDVHTLSMVRTTCPVLREGSKTFIELPVLPTFL